MKRTYITYIMLCVGLILNSCDDFLEINPDSEVINDELFSNAEGVEDALNGIYSTLNKENLYGKKLAWELPEILSQDLNGPTDIVYTQLATYNYNDANTFINSLWKDMYQTIGYTNNVILNLEEKNPNIFPHYDMYLGEAYGLRGFLHFELLRLFAPHIENGSANERGIPYVKIYTFEPTPFSTVSEVYDAVILDLKRAQELLIMDEMYVAFPRVDYTSGQVESFLKGREIHFNYYAATAALARVYRMKGDLENAKIEALKIINSGKFPLASADKIVNLVAGALSPSESIFGLFSNDYIKTTEATLFSTTSFLGFPPFQKESGGNPLQEFRDVYNQYLGANSGTDFRLQWFRRSFEGASMLNVLKVVDVLQINTGIPPSQRGLLPGISMIRVPEMYYIIAEAELVNGNTAEATSVLNQVLLSRGLAKLQNREPAIIPDLDFLYNERHKELFSEGQRWFDMKKRNMNIISNEESKILPASDKIYVLPIPIEEFELRN